MDLKLLYPYLVILIINLNSSNFIQLTINTLKTVGTTTVNTFIFLKSVLSLATAVFNVFRKAYSNKIETIQKKPTISL